MTDVSVRDVIGALPRMSLADRQQIVDAIKALSQFDGALPSLSAHTVAPKPSTEGTDAELMLRAVSDIMRARGVEFATPHNLRRSSAWSKFRDDVDALAPWLQKCKISRNQKLSLFCISVDCLVEHLAFTGMTVGSRMIMQNIGKVPMAVDRRFPGYARAGLLGALVRE